MIQHEIDENPRHRNVQPNRKRPSRQPPMADSAIPQAKIDCHPRQKWNRGGEDRVRYKDREIGCPDRRWRIFGKSSRLAPFHDQMKKQVARQKHDGHSKATEHRPLVRDLVASLDQHQTEDQQHTGQAVERSVHMRKDLLCRFQAVRLPFSFNGKPKATAFKDSRHSRLRLAVKRKLITCRLSPVRSAERRLFV